MRKLLATLMITGLMASTTSAIAQGCSACETMANEASCPGGGFNGPGRCNNPSQPIYDGGRATNAAAVAAGAAGVYGAATGSPVAIGAAAALGMGAAVGGAMGDMGISPSDTANAASDAAAAEGVGGTGY